MGSFKKNIGVLLVLLGAILLILPTIIPAMVDALDENPYTIAGVALIIIGLIAHILLNKYLPLDDEKN